MEVVSLKQCLGILPPVCGGTSWFSSHKTIKRVWKKRWLAELCVLGQSISEKSGFSFCFFTEALKVLAILWVCAFLQDLKKKISYAHMELKYKHSVLGEGVQSASAFPRRSESSFCWHMSFFRFKNALCFLDATCFVLSHHHFSPSTVDGKVKPV